MKNVVRWVAIGARERGKNLHRPRLNGLLAPVYDDLATGWADLDPPKNEVGLPRQIGGGDDLSEVRTLIHRQTIMPIMD